MDEATKFRGFMATVLFHAAVIAMLVLLRIYGNVKIPDAQGITINFGTDMTGAGEVEPQQQEDNQPNTPSPATAPPVSNSRVRERVKESAPKLLTQENEDAPTVKKQDNENDLAEKKKLEEKRRREQEERELQRQADLERQRIEAEERRQAELEAQRLEAEKKKQDQVNAIKGRIGRSFGGSQGGTGTQSQGENQGVGNQGDPTGSVDSKSQTGGGRGAGISFSLAGRNVIGSLAKPEYNVNEYGDVVVTIKVNKEGDVISAVPGAKGTTTTDSRLWEAARKAAVQAKFNRVTSQDAPAVQQGTITYKFKLL